MSLDQTSDLNGTQFAGYAKQYRVPDFVKQADTSEVFGPVQENMSASAYADRINKQFPCHTKAATWSSALHFYANEHKVPTDKRANIHWALEKLANHWGILDDVLELKTVFSELNKEAVETISDSDYLFVLPTDEGTKRFAPMRTATEIKVASDWFLAGKNNFAFEEKIKLANTLLTRAEKLGVTLPNLPAIEQLAGQGIGTTADMTDAMTRRFEMAKKAGIVDNERFALWESCFEKLGQIHQAKLGPEDGIKIAQLIDRFDHEYRLTDRYGSQLRRPEEIMFALPYSKAAEALDSQVRLTNGYMVDKKELKKLATEALEPLFGTEFTENITDGLFKLDTEKLAQQLAALPAPDADDFIELANSLGVRATKAAGDLPSAALKAAAARS